ncbi:MAG: undecaprenyldiphospho-muramoylpentapeptide beta-N-acetylglucosaminyltransferase [Myxococcales bacterium]|nr:undecaprenyldiphospho-muramoylpentapeptide beta-N-acetylglucosaminyltransferase [Myxococcales bacterium]
MSGGGTNPRVMIAGGGTGGHVFPMIAVGEALRGAISDVEVTFVGTEGGIEGTAVPKTLGRLELLDVLPLRGRGISGFFRGTMRALALLPRCRALVRREAPAVVFSVGGYAAGPVTLAAWSLGIPVTLLEPNAVLGFTNKLLARFVRRAYLGFPETQSAFPPERRMWTGVPLRKRFLPSPYRASEEVVVLVMGGSQGAKRLNEDVPRALAMHADKAFRVVHQTGRDKEAAVLALYRELGLEARARVVPFIDDVADALANCDVVVERSGAGSLSELCAIGRAAVLVPYPYAADDHQRHNAESLVRDGAAVCVLQADATTERLAEELGILIGTPALRARMAERASARGRPDAAHVIARDLLMLADAHLDAPSQVSS